MSDAFGWQNFHSWKFLDLTLPIFANVRFCWHWEANVFFRACTREYRAVCGSDRMTYDNICRQQFTKLMMDRAVTINYEHHSVSQKTTGVTNRRTNRCHVFVWNKIINCIKCEFCTVLSFKNIFIEHFSWYFLVNSTTVCVLSKNSDFPVEWNFIVVKCFACVWQTSCICTSVV